MLCIIHSNAEEESVSSRIRKNLTPQCATMEIDGVCSSIVTFQFNRTQGKRMMLPIYKPSEKALSRPKKGDFGI